MDELNKAILEISEQNNSDFFLFCGTISESTVDNFISILRDKNQKKQNNGPSLGINVKSLTSIWGGYWIRTDYLSYTNIYNIKQKDDFHMIGVGTRFMLFGLNTNVIFNPKP